MFRIYNSSNLVVLANVNCNFHVDGQRVKAGSLYDGEERWVVFPQERLQGWFEVEDLARKVGKTIEDMCRERTLLNRTKQLTMLLELEFRDELGEERRLPPRHWYFDFVRWSWIPHIGERASL